VDSQRPKDVVQTDAQKAENGQLAPVLSLNGKILAAHRDDRNEEQSPERKADHQKFSSGDGFQHPLGDRVIQAPEDSGQTGTGFSIKREIPGNVAHFASPSQVVKWTLK
jgi:hypothetical protein